MCNPGRISGRRGHETQALMQGIHMHAALPAGLLT